MRIFSSLEPYPGGPPAAPAKSAAVAVHSAGMIEVLRKLYDAGALADELQGVRRTAPAKRGQV